ncbi:hypothetical protein ACWD25_50325, partial [Streptomyces sp. NPDC002920]
GAEAILRLRTLIANGDFDTYWTEHLHREHERLYPTPETGPGQHNYSTPADPTARTFYRELRPISEEFVPEALAVSGLDRDRLTREGLEPSLALARFGRWVGEVSDGAQPVMCGYPASYDWMFLYWYLIRFTGASPFGHSGCLDMKTLYAAKAGVPLRSVGKRTMPPELLPGRRHTHHALDDAVEQAELFANLMAWPGVG